MNVTIIGTGKMGRAIASRMLAGGNNVTFMTRNPDKASGVVQSLSAEAKSGATVHVQGLDSEINSPVIISALSYSVAEGIIKRHAKQLSGKILVDITNPLNQTYDDLVTPPGSSAAEELAKVAPKDTHVVKAFNTTFAGPLGQGHVAGQPLDVFIAGDDQQAKATIAKLVQEGGQHPIDAGPLKRARQLEGLALLNITLQSKADKPWMNAVKIIS